MYSRLIARRSRGLAVLVVAVVTAIVAGAAHAAPLVAQDSMSTMGSGTSFQFRDGEVDWYWGNGKISAHLSGKIRIDEAKGSCARMRLEYFNDSVSIGIPQYGGTVCAPDSESHDYTVDLNPWGSPDIDLVKVSLQKETASGWSTVESDYFKPTLSSDSVRITEDGVDFGNDLWGIPSPTGSATIDWNQGEGMDITPHLRGTLFLNNVAGLCARIHIMYGDESNNFFHDEYSGRACAPDNSLYGATIDMAPFTSDQIAFVDVYLETQSSDGSWHAVNLGDAEGVLHSPDLYYQ
jgi:hypothetical protein